MEWRPFPSSKTPMQCSRAAARRPAIPVFWRLTDSPSPGCRSAQRNQQIVSKNQAVSACGNGNGSLRILAQSQAWNTQIRRFLLYAARIGNHRSGAANQVHKLNVSKWFCQLDSRAALEGSEQSEFLHALARARVDGKYKIDLLPGGNELSDQSSQNLPIIDVGRPMQRNYSVRLVGESKSF